MIPGRLVVKGPLKSAGDRSEGEGYLKGWGSLGSLHPAKTRGSRLKEGIEPRKGSYTL